MFYKIAYDLLELLRIINFRFVPVSK